MASFSGKSGTPIDEQRPAAAARADLSALRARAQSARCCTERSGGVRSTSHISQKIIGIIKISLKLGEIICEIDKHILIRMDIHSFLVPRRSALTPRRARKRVPRPGEHDGAQAAHGGELEDEPRAGRG